MVLLSHLFYLHFELGINSNIHIKTDGVNSGATLSWAG